MLFIAYYTPILFTNCKLISLHTLNILYSKLFFALFLIYSLNLLIQRNILALEFYKH